MNTDGQLVGESIRSILDEFKVRLLLIASSPRGGSTFACELVGAHQEIFFVPWNDKAIYNREAYKREPDIVFRQRLLREPLYFDSDRLRNILGLQKFSQLSVIIDQACHHRRIDELICLQGMIYWLLDESRLPLTKMRYWVIKTNTFRSLDELLKLLPDARCVVVQRDPRSVSLSLAKVRANRARFDDTHLIAAAVDWTRQATKFAKLMQKYKNRVSLVRYEKLVIDAESSLNMLYGLLRLNPIDSNILNQVVSRLAYKTTRSNYDRTMIDLRYLPEAAAPCAGFRRVDWRDGGVNSPLVRLAQLVRLPKSLARCSDMKCALENQELWQFCEARQESWRGVSTSYAAGSLPEANS